MYLQNQVEAQSDEGKEMIALRIQFQARQAVYDRVMGGEWPLKPKPPAKKVSDALLPAIEEVVKQVQSVYPDPRPDLDVIEQVLKRLNREKRQIHYEVMAKERGLTASVPNDGLGELQVSGSQSGIRRGLAVEGLAVDSAAGSGSIDSIVPKGRQNQTADHVG